MGVGIKTLSVILKRIFFYFEGFPYLWYLIDYQGWQWRWVWWWSTSSTSTVFDRMLEGWWGRALLPSCHKTRVQVSTGAPPVQSGGGEGETCHDLWGCLLSPGGCHYQKCCLLVLVLLVPQKFVLPCQQFPRCTFLRLSLIKWKTWQFIKIKIWFTWLIKMKQFPK